MSLAALPGMVGVANWAEVSVAVHETADVPSPFRCIVNDEQIVARDWPRATSHQLSARLFMSRVSQPIHQPLSNLEAGLGRDRDWGFDALDTLTLSYQERGPFRLKLISWWFQTGRWPGPWSPWKHHLLP